MSDIFVSDIYIYPIKSAGAIRCQSAAITATGFEHDRRWMVVDASGRFLTQRQEPVMALVRVEITDGMLVMHAPSQVNPLRVPLHPPSSASIDVQIWDDICTAWDCGDEAAAWWRGVINQPCKLVYMPDSTQRLVSATYAHNQETVGFAEGYPFLLISQASLDDLNRRLATPVEMLRFRPNLVVKGCAPFAEDSWDRFQVGSQVIMRRAKPCSRCVIVNIDPNSAASTREPLYTLSKFRKEQNKIFFGQNVLHETSGVITVGDSVQLYLS